MSRRFQLTLRYFRLVVAWFGLAALSMLSWGCAVNGPETRGTVVLPIRHEVAVSPMVIHANRKMASDDPVLVELMQRREDIADRLLLPPSDRPVEVYLFDDAEDYRWYLQRYYSALGDRRAIFVKEGERARVFSYWHERLAEDLRHELTHAYLHSVLDVVPLWLDEGIAEYFEVEPGERGFHAQHVFLLGQSQLDGDWRPDLNRLERMVDPAEMKQRDYAEAWLWVHYLIEAGPDTRRLLQDYLTRPTDDPTADAGSLSTLVHAKFPDIESRLLKHLEVLVERL